MGLMVLVEGGPWDGINFGRSVIGGPAKEGEKKEKE